MKRFTNRVLLLFALIIIIGGVFSGINVYGQSVMVLLDDGGSSPGSWNMHENRIASASSLGSGPPSGNPGNYYYFTNTGGGRDVGSARISRDIMFNADQKILSNLGQLKLDFYMNIYCWNNDSDKVVFYLHSFKDGGRTELHDSGFYTNDQSWQTIGKTGLAVPKGADYIRIEIVAERRDGSDLDVYLDNIRLYLYDETLPVMTSAAVTGIRDNNNTVLPLKKDDTGKYLDNWVNTTDTILGKVDFNEPVKAEVPGYPHNLKTNILKSNGLMLYGNVGDGSGSYTYSHEYRMPLAGADRLKAGDSTVKFMYSAYDQWGPFDFMVYDLGGNYGLSGIMKPNIDAYNIQLDNASPTITTPWDSYEKYVPGRTSVDIVVNEENRGTVQSPLTLTYYWEYLDSSNKKVKGPVEEKLISSTVEPVVGNINTTYTVKIDIPNGSSIPPYQDFMLSAEVNDEARNPYSNRILYSKVNQKDSTPPVITWVKSIHEDGTEVNLNVEEDTRYTKSRTVSFSANDLESGVE